MARLEHVRRDRGLLAIIFYKSVKGVLGLLCALVLLVLARRGLEGRLLGFAEQLRHHTGIWSLALTELVVRAASRRGIWIVGVALVGDAISSLVEAWSLFHGWW